MDIAFCYTKQDSRDKHCDITNKEFEKQVEMLFSTQGYHQME